MILALDIQTDAQQGQSRFDTCHFSGWSEHFDVEIRIKSMNRSLSQKKTLGAEGSSHKKD